MTILTGFKLPEPLIPGSIPWLSKYSATQAAGICGLSDWDTPRSLYDAKKGIVPPKPQSEVMARGHYWESQIIQWVAENNPDWLVVEGGGATWQHRIREWQIATPDAEATVNGEFELIDAKTAQNVHEWDGLPLVYQVQGMWLMDTIGARRVHFAVCGPFELFNRKPRIYTLDYDPVAAAQLRERVLTFDTELNLGIQPDADHTKDCDRLAVRYANTAIVDDPGVEIPDEIAVPYLSAFAEASAVEAAKKSTGSALLAYLGKSKKATYRGSTIATRVNGKGDNPPSLRATNGLADKATELLINVKGIAA